MNLPAFMVPSWTRKRISPRGEIADTMLIDFLSPVFTTTGVCPTGPHVVPAW